MSIQAELLPLMYWFELQDVMFIVKCLKVPPDNFISSTTYPSTTHLPDPHHLTISNSTFAAHLTLVTTFLTASSNFGTMHLAHKIYPSYTTTRS